MVDNNNLYLSITYYDDPKQTIFRKVHTSFLGAINPISLTCEMKKNKYRKYKPILLEVFTKSEPKAHVALARG